MQEYKYTALNLEHKKITGYFVAESKEDLAMQLSQQGLYLVSCKEYSGKTPSAFFTMGTGGVSIKDMTGFCRQFSIMLNVGIPLIEALEVLRAQSFSKFFSNLLDVITEDVKGGMMFSEALNKHETAFPEFFRSMVKVGELSGKIDVVMSSLADYYERDAEIKKKVKGAFAYPIMLGCMAVAIVILMVVYVVPTFRESLSELDIVPTGITKFVWDFSDFILNNWLYILAIICVVALAIYIFGRTERGKYCADWLKVHFPLIKRVNIDLIAARFARGFGLLISSGMDIAGALDSIEIVLGNRFIEQKFHKASEDIKHGKGIAEAFTEYDLFPSLLTQMVAIGEKTNQMDEILAKSTNYFDRQVEDTLNSVTAIIQPVMLIIMGGVIGGMFIAVYSPMLTIMTSL